MIEAYGLYTYPDKENSSLISTNPNAYGPTEFNVILLEREFKDALRNSADILRVYCSMM
jgi:hypothetical protein